MIRCAACDGALPDAATLRGLDRLYGGAREYSVAICSDCGSGRTLPLVTNEDLGAFYPDGYDAHGLPANPLLRRLAVALSENRLRRAFAREPFCTLTRRSPGRLLDVGSGRGDLGVALGRLGWRVTGLEPSPEAVAQARARGIETEQGMLTDGVRPGGGYDAVVFNHSFEHLADPFEDLCAARGLLRGGGLVLLALPNFGSWQARQFGSYWFHLDLPRHRTHFTELGLQVLLRRAGFDRIRTATSTSADGLPMSLQYRLLGRRRLSTGTGRYASIATTLAFVPITVVVSSFAREGDLLYGIAERRHKAN